MDADGTGNGGPLQIYCYPIQTSHQLITIQNTDSRINQSKLYYHLAVHTTVVKVEGWNLCLPSSESTTFNFPLTRRFLTLRSESINIPVIVLTNRALHDYK